MQQKNDQYYSNNRIWHEIGKAIPETCDSEWLSSVKGEVKKSFQIERYTDVSELQKAPLHQLDLLYQAPVCMFKKEAKRY